MNSTESKMSVWELMLLTAVNMIGAGIILLPASLARWEEFPSFHGL